MWSKRTCTVRISLGSGARCRLTTHLSKACWVLPYWVRSWATASGAGVLPSLYPPLINLVRPCARSAHRGWDKCHMWTYSNALNVARIRCGLIKATRKDVHVRRKRGCVPGSRTDSTVHLAGRIHLTSAYTLQLYFGYVLTGPVPPVHSGFSHHENPNEALCFSLSIL